MFDLLVIVMVAVGLLGIAWKLAQSDAPLEQPPLISVDDTLPNSDELQLLLPLERIGMVLSQESIAGDAQVAIDHLEQKCRMVLATPDEWVLSLSVSDEEQRLLEATQDGTPIPLGQESLPSGTKIYPLVSPTGRVGIQEATGPGALLGRRLLCWGFTLSEGVDTQTIWFARPREKLPPSGSREGLAP